MIIPDTALIEMLAIEDAKIKNLDYNDSIVSIEEIDNIEMLDFNVTGNQLFYCDDVLVHNSATNNTDTADNSNVSDSMGTVMTADFMLFLLQNEELKQKKEIVCKITKNRFGGVTDTWTMGINYENMKFSDIQSEESYSFDSDSGTGSLHDDFGLETQAEKQQQAEKFADKEIKDIYHRDIKKVKEIDSNPFDNDDMKEINDILGLS